MPTFQMSHNDANPRDHTACGHLVEHSPGVLLAPTFDTPHRLLPTKRTPECFKWDTTLTNTCVQDWQVWECSLLLNFHQYTAYSPFPLLICPKIMVSSPEITWLAGILLNSLPAASMLLHLAFLSMRLSPPETLTLTHNHFDWSVHEKM